MIAEVLVTINIDLQPVDLCCSHCVRFAADSSFLLLLREKFLACLHFTAQATEKKSLQPDIVFRATGFYEFCPVQFVQISIPVPLWETVLHALGETTRHFAVDEKCAQNRFSDKNDLVCVCVPSDLRGCHNAFKIYLVQLPVCTITGRARASCR